jgi:hypothetical protein
MPYGIGRFVTELIRIAKELDDELTTYEGSIDLDVSTAEGRKFIQETIGDGDVLAFSMPECSGVNDQNRHADFGLDATLYFGVARNQTVSLIDLVSFLDELKDNWMDLTKFTTQYAPSSASNVSWQKPRFDYTQDPAFGSIAIRVETRM